MQNRIDKLTFLSFWMTLLIVIYHLSPHLLKINNICTVYITNFVETFGSISLNYFFAISAYNFFKSSKTYKKKIQSRIVTLLLPFFLWNTLYIPLYCFTKGLPSFVQILKGFSLEPFDGPFWYIFVLYIFFLLSSKIIQKLFDKKYFIIIILCLCILSAYFHMLILTNKLNFLYDYWLERNIRMLPAYLFGCYYGYKKSKIQIENINKRVIFCVGVILPMFIATISGDGFISTLVLYVCTLSIYILTPNIVLKNNSMFKQNVFITYAIHEGLIIIYIYVLNKYNLIQNGLIYYIGFLIMGLIIIMLITLILNSIISLDSSNLLNLFLTGGRCKKNRDNSY